MGAGIMCVSLLFPKATLIDMLLVNGMEYGGFEVKAAFQITEIHHWRGDYGRTALCHATNRVTKVQLLTTNCHIADQLVPHERLDNKCEQL